MKSRKRPELSRKLMELIPALMREIRAELHLAATKPSKQKSGHLTISQFRLLRQIRRGLDQVSKLSDHLGVSQPTISRMALGLMRRGLIERRPHAEDGRSSVLRLTDQGERIFQSIRAQAELGLARKLRRLSPRQRQKLYQGLELVESALGPIREANP